MYIDNWNILTKYDDHHSFPIQSNPIPETYIAPKTKKTCTKALDTYKEHHMQTNEKKYIHNINSKYTQLQRKLMLIRNSKQVMFNQFLKNDNGFCISDVFGQFVPDAGSIARERPVREC